MPRDAASADGRWSKLLFETGGMAQLLGASLQTLAPGHRPG